MPEFGQNPAARAEAAEKSIIDAIDAHVEEIARSRKYNDAAALAGYASSTVPEWAAEARAFVSWRDQIWLTAFQILADVRLGSRAVPSEAEAIASLPVVEWPD